MSKEDKKEHILDTAEKVFAEFGYEGASTRFLASQAGVNMAMINYYFGSKDGLLQAVLQRRIVSMRNLLEEVKGMLLPAGEKLMRALEVYVNRISTNNCFHRIIHREISLNQRSELSDKISDNVFMNVQTFRDIIREGVQNGAFRKVDVEMTVANIMGTIYYIINSRAVSARLLNIDFQQPEVMETEVRPRIKKFLHDYLQAYLTNHDLQKQ
ncbi:TetR/AcrR family transcriptional regulator [Pontibacter liquoris]|uniref:TetR/AcrR family transcriptional regulator n=1 Tax=Pontibacter liquoris TaxID=2905677 RepID=UPI001FA6F2F4|nr:TetR/AcrR family transcriptional regulator [Pontibacter liquoris]